MENVAYIDPPRTERIEGKTYLMSPQPRMKHIFIAIHIFDVFNHYLKGKTCTAIPDGADVHLDNENVYVPDAMIVCDRSKIHDNGVYGAPDLVVEVLSPSTRKHDRGPKMQHYAAAGVKEYWIVDPLAEAVEVYLNHDGVFVLDEIYEDYDDEDRARMTEKELADIHTDIPVSLYDDFIVHLHDIFEDTTFE